MAEPVDVAEDFLMVFGTVRRATLAVYVPGEKDSWRDPIPVRGVKGEERTAMQGPQPVTTCTWELVGPTPDQRLARPPLRSKITSGGKVWAVTSVTEDPGGPVYTCETILL